MKSKSEKKRWSWFEKFTIAVMVAAALFVGYKALHVPQPEPCAVCDRVFPEGEDSYGDEWNMADYGDVKVLIMKIGGEVFIELQTQGSFPDVTQLLLAPGGEIKRWNTFGLADGGEILYHVFDPNLEDGTLIIEKSLGEDTAKYRNYPNLFPPFLKHRGPAREFGHSGGPQGRYMWQDMADELVDRISQHDHPVRSR